MCVDCFERHWEGRDPRAAWAEVSVVDRMLIDHTAKQIAVDYDDDPWEPAEWEVELGITRRDPNSIKLPFNLFIGGPLHVAVEDNNYDSGCYHPEIEQPPKHRPSCHLWNALSEDTRSFVVATLRAYDPELFAA